MRNKVVLVALLCILSVISSSCRADNKPNWPKHVWESMVIPHEAQNLHYAYYAGTYQITYSMEACYPPNAVIYSMADSMKTKGWERLRDDPLNPGQKLSIAISPTGMSLTSHPWTDYWRDASGNSVFYGYQYEIGDLPIESYARQLEKSCALQGVIIFSPADVFKKIQEVSRRALDKGKKGDMLQ
jgi:hypothetical protein